MSLRHLAHACHAPRVQECVQSSPLQASEEFDGPKMLLCITTNLSPNYVQKQSRWACCRSDGPLVEGGPFKGHPLLGRARPSRPEDKLKSIVAKLHCHLSPALADQKKASEEGRSEWPELGGNCHNMSTWKCAFGGPPRDQKIKKL